MSFVKGELDQITEPVDIIQNTNSKGWDLKNVEYKGVHLIRNPYELLLSNIRYHSKTNSENEPSTYLIIDGVIYKDYLNQLPDINEKAKFEIDNIFGRTLNSMLNFDYANKNIMHVKLDSFKKERLEETVRNISCHLGFDKAHEEKLLTSYSEANNIYKDNSSHVTRKKGESVFEIFDDSVFEYLNYKFPKLQPFVQQYFKENAQ